MGEQVRIVDLAHDLIRLSGYEASRDIDVTFVGLRPGEKMEEELFFTDETRETTADERIFVVRSGERELPPEFTAQLVELETGVRANDEAAVQTVLRQFSSERCTA